MRTQVNIIQYDADLEAIRKACADLLEPIQVSDADQEVNAIYVDSADVTEAVRRINALGYTTDEGEE